MEYQVTATRRRPQRFEDLLGQEFVAATLQKSIEAGKIAHAYLFSGPRGCGKTSSARILAKVLNCTEGTKTTPCGHCTSCTEITAGSCLDVIEIDGASNTGVNDVRQIKDEILFPPNANRYKIYIIDEVHMLSTSAFNALLKTIEEPPPYVVFIFATTEIHKVPATIKSRCQQFNFKLVPVEILKKALQDAADELNIKADEEALYWVAREATGSVRDAYTLFDQVAAFSDGHITFEKIHEKLGLTGIDSINKMVSLCVQKNGQEALNTLDEILQNGISVEQIVSDCAGYFRSLLLVKHGITKEALIGQRADRFPQEILSAWNSVQIEQALSIMLQLFKDIRFSIDPRYELELAVSRLAWLSDYVSPADLKKAFNAAKEVLSSNNSTQKSKNFTGSFSNGQMTPQTNTGKDSQGDTPKSFSEADSLKNQFRAYLQKGNAKQSSTANEDVRKNEAIKPNPQTENSNSKLILQDTNVLQGSGTQTLSDQTVRSTEKLNFDNLEEIKQRLTENLSKKYGLLSSAVGQSMNWEFKNEALTITAKTSFDISLFDKQLSVLRDSIEDITGLRINIILKEYIEPQKTDEEKENSEPLKIRTITDVFMGKIVEKKIAVSDVFNNEDENSETFVNAYQAEQAKD